MRIILYTITITILCIAAYAETPAAVPDGEISETVQVVPYKLDSWFGEKISEEVRLRDLRLWGENTYSYKGKIKVGDNIYYADFDKKLWRVIRYEESYYFICLDYFPSAEIAFYCASVKASQSNLQQESITAIPDEILFYDFIPRETEKNDFDTLKQLYQYRVGVLMELLNLNEFEQMTKSLDFFVTRSAYSAEFCYNGYWTGDNFLRYLCQKVQEVTISMNKKQALFDVLVKMLYHVPKDDHWGGNTSDIAQIILILDYERGKDVVSRFLDYYEKNDTIRPTEYTKITVISDLKSLLKKYDPNKLSEPKQKIPCTCGSGVPKFN